ncbi:MAG: stage II sporulation protein D [Ruminococcus sp.]|nr:stage II sporulation protein D [Ruminococcus sp.]
MKDYLQLLAATAIILLLIPCIGFAKRQTDSAATSAESDSSAVKLLSTETGEITELSMHDYIVGSVFAQMPADFEDEALKAQAVLAKTYAERRRLSEASNPTEALNGALLSDDTTLYQAFFTESQARELYGDNYDTAYKKISAAADYAEGLTLTYDGDPILVAFHGISFGYTESALTMWGEDIPYLSSVESLADPTLDICTTTVTLTDSELREALMTEYSLTSLDADLNDLITIAQKSEQGTVLKVTISDSLYDADTLCDALSLPSQHFTITCDDDEITFTCLGCGHLVGMSQYGANEMAKSGSLCEEILLHYFPNTVLISS